MCSLLFLITAIIVAINAFLGHTVSDVCYIVTALFAVGSSIETLANKLTKK